MTVFYQQALRCQRLSEMKESSDAYEAERLEEERSCVISWVVAGMVVSAC